MSLARPMGHIAIVETGGKQYLVKPKDKIYIEKLPQNTGDKVEFDKVLLTAEFNTDGNAEKTMIGKPYLEGAKISAEVVGQKRLPKVTVFRYHSKTRYRKMKGHRQSVTKVSILDLN